MEARSSSEPSHFWKPGFSEPPACPWVALLLNPQKVNFGMTWNVEGLGNRFHLFALAESI